MNWIELHEDTGVTALATLFIIHSNCAIQELEKGDIDLNYFLL